MMYGIRFMDKSPSAKESRAKLYSSEPSKESIITEKKLFMIECKIEILNLQSPSNNFDNNNSSVEDRIKYYSEQLEEAEKVVIQQDPQFVDLVLNENRVSALEQLKIKVLDPNEID